MTDVSRVIEIEGSRRRLLVLCAIGVAVTAGFILIAILPFLIGFQLPAASKFTGYFGAALGTLEMILKVLMIVLGTLFCGLLGLVGAVFLGLCTAGWAWQLFASRGPVVTITPDGIQDLRVAAEFIPWNVVRRIWTWDPEGRHPAMALEIDPAVEKRLTLSIFARWTRNLNRAFGVDGLWVSTQGLKTDFPTLHKICLDYVQAKHNQSGTSACKAL